MIRGGEGRRRGRRRVIRGGERMRGRRGKEEVIRGGEEERREGGAKLK